MNCLSCNEPIPTGRCQYCSLCLALGRLGFDFQTYRSFYEKQGGRCGICNQEAPFRGKGRLVLDHCHDTNKARGLLCSQCNVGIGALKDSPRLAKNAFLYLNQDLSATTDTAEGSLPTRRKSEEKALKVEEKAKKIIVRRKVSRATWLKIVAAKRQEHGW